jgi:CheY-like chemotaxis protein
LEQKDYSFERIEENSQHLMSVINDILDISKIESGKLELSPEAFPLNAMLANVESIFTFRLEEKSQVFEKNYADSLPEYINADEHRLEQVIVNLLSNAVKFTPEHGHISFTAYAEPEGRDKTRLFFSVKDTGIGITDEQKSRLFHSFEQADSSISRKFGGTGLGLAISKNITEMMGGDIDVDSVFGEGSEFRFNVLVDISSAEEVAEKAKEDALDTSVLKGKKLLLAEDIEINREIVIAMLDGTGIEIVEAENGKVAVERFSEDPESFDFIFMDVQMPEMDGYEATQKIREIDASYTGRVPIIAMTANVFREDIEKCLGAGMDDHVGKPLSYEQVVSVLNKWADITKS